MAIEKEMLDCWRDIETTLELCERAKSKKGRQKLKDYRTVLTLVGINLMAIIKFIKQMSLKRGPRLRLFSTVRNWIMQ